MKTLEEKVLNTKIISSRTWIAFTIFFLFILGSIHFWKWLNKQPLENGALKPLRQIMDVNETVFNKILNDNHTEKTYPISNAVTNVRVNGAVGMSDDFDTANWKLRVIHKTGDTLFLTMNDIKSLPKTEVIYNFKCIEGWSQVTYWSGVKFTDFVSHFGLKEESKMNYVGLNTPDHEYYVGIDRKSILHPQTILCYEMNGKPLPMNQGYPLRLIIPVKYGIKHLKRIGTIFFSDVRPNDYWFERGYDYYSGL